MLFAPPIINYLSVKYLSQFDTFSNLRAALVHKYTMTMKKVKKKGKKTQDISFENRIPNHKAYQKVEGQNIDVNYTS